MLLLRVFVYFLSQEAKHARKTIQHVFNLVDRHIVWVTFIFKAPTNEENRTILFDDVEQCWELIRIQRVV